VEPFKNSFTRRIIADNFLRYCQEIQNYVSSVIWVDGTFVEDKLNPTDIDLAVWISVNDLDALPFSKRNELYNKVFNNKQSRKFLKIDNNIVVICPQNHSLYNIYLNAQEFYPKLFGETREGHPKGYVLIEVPLVFHCDHNIQSDPRKTCTTHVQHCDQWTKLIHCWQICLV
jgi:hypothetical protein